MSAARPPVFDDRYTAPVEASRRGAHRARPNPLTAFLPVLAGVAVVALVITGTFALLRPSGEDSGGSNVAAAPTADNPTSDPQASGGPAPSPSGADEPSAGAGDEPSGDSGDAGADDEAEVDRATPVRVLNSIRVSGLAARVKRALERDGWSVGETGNSNQRNLATTRVYYARTSDAATAKALVADLGFGEAVRSATNARAGTTVVLGQDAQ